MAQAYGSMAFPTPSSALRGRSPIPRVDCGLQVDHVQRGAPAPKRLAMSPRRRAEQDAWREGAALLGDGGAAAELRRAAARRSARSRCGQCSLLNLCGMEDAWVEPEEIWSHGPGLEAREQQVLAPMQQENYYMGTAGLETPGQQAWDAPVGGTSSGKPPLDASHQASKERQCRLDVNDCL
mmetsp:Transcript_25244/g.79634  ORF Transcript_25244/g.79634 Transcript_25244/m.79634 type:complete len:181 (-) Transcript_25244:192-734(-)